MQASITLQTTPHFRIKQVTIEKTTIWKQIHQIHHANQQYDH